MTSPLQNSETSYFADIGPVFLVDCYQFEQTSESCAAHSGYINYDIKIKIIQFKMVAVNLLSLFEPTFFC